MRMNTPRITPLEPEDWSEEQSNALGMDIKELQSKIGHADKVFNILKTLVRYPALLKAWVGFANHIMFGSSLSPRDREIAILRIGWLCQSGYEFGQHILMGQEAGLSDDEIKAIAKDLNVAEIEVRRMESRLNSRDTAFDLPNDANEDTNFAPAAYLESDNSDPAQELEQQDWNHHHQQRLFNAMQTLDQRSQAILAARWLSEDKVTLQELANQYQISAERIRQLEKNAMKKLKAAMS